MSSSQINSMERKQNLGLMIIFFVIFLVIHVDSEIIAIKEDEMTILLELKKHWGNSSDIFQMWNLNSSPCNNWPGIACSSDGFVTGLSLRHQKLGGNIVPPIICELKNLVDIALADSNLSGEFPTVFYKCSKLKVLDLSGNQFHGPLPTDIHRMSRLTFLDLIANRFNGTIPKSIAQLTELKRLYLSKNMFEGKIPREIGNLSNLEVLGMSYMKKFEFATIPDELSKLNLKVLLIIQSNLIGNIPESFSSLSSLKTLDLSRNYLNGSIPGWLFHLKSLTKVDLSWNRLSGKIPSQLDEDFDYDFNGNFNLCTSNTSHASKYLPLCTNHKQCRIIVLAPLVGTILVIATVLLLCWRKYCWRKRQGIGDRKFIHCQRTELTESEILLNLTEENFIGRGGSGDVYRIAVHQNGSHVAVKRICKERELDRRLEKQFLAELQILNFGLSKVLAKQEDTETASAVAGTFGYIAPEYAYATKVSTKSDVYSFGVVLLELATGKEPVNRDDYMNLAQWARKHLVEGNLIEDALDEEIKGPNNLKAMTTVFKLGMMCTSKLPSIRPSMREVLEALLFLDTSYYHSQDLTKLRIEQIHEMNKYHYLMIIFFVSFPLLHANAQITVVKEDEKTILLQLKSYLKNSSDIHQRWNLGSSPCSWPEISCSHGSVTGIKFKNKNLTATPPIICKLKNLTHISLASNILSGLFPTTLYNCSKVKLVDISHNQFYGPLPTDIHRMSRLTTLDLRFNIFNGTIPGAVGQLSELKHLQLRGNNFEGSIPWEIGNLSNLETLDISEMEIFELATIPEELGKLKDLKELRIIQFRTSKSSGQSWTYQTASVVAGTFGYIAPAKVSMKSDVYNFGVVLLELVTGREPVHRDEDMNLAQWEWKHIEEDKLFEDALDEEIKEPSNLKAMSDVFKLDIKRKKSKVGLKSKTVPHWSNYGGIYSLSLPPPRQLLISDPPRHDGDSVLSAALRESMHIDLDGSV
ncbi:hypothetical protein K7X08_028568 [Anisodus acutangulus]|uniref:Protein kinase domain-containing protein n=1 Tax=Anisodus acutangulus TaxID=402998 RepID=A0A9Q1M6R7_9SOLA|nr:hypothetical protein K7X08_028568 [Anisodus acutangulus]